ncbi:MAG: hypothetical protein OIF38_17300, partial [Cellvibrionaceae bacterium]|nr:hypothetical protein [Cellvibrionaceae bacterium]
MINIPNVLRPTPSRKTLKKNLPGQTAVSNTQATDGVGEYQSVDRRSGEDRRKQQRPSNLETRSSRRRKDDK